MDHNRAVTDFLSSTGTKMNIKYIRDVKGFPFDDMDLCMHRKYRITLSRKGDSYCFPFYGSARDWKEMKDPNEYDVLSALTIDDVGSMATFVDDYGYVIKDRKSFIQVQKIWQGCRRELRMMRNLFDRKELVKLREILS